MEDGDIHICGACKKQFSDILLFMRHKNEGNCSSRHKRGVSVSLQTSDLIDTASALASISESVLDSPLSGTKHVTLTYDTRKELHQSENSSTPIPLVQSGHEFISSTCTAPLQPQTHQQEQHIVEDHSTGSPVQQNGGDQLIGQQGEPVLETRNESGEIRGCYRRHFLDVEEDVATLLANHFVSDGPLQPYPTNSESLLTYRYGTMSEQLVLSDSRGDLDFESDVNVPERRQEEICSDQGLDAMETELEKSQQKRQLPALVPVLKKTEASSIPKLPAVRTNGNRAGEKKGYLCVIDGCAFHTSSSRDMGRHMRVHTGEKPFKCLQCGRTFSRHDKLSTHLRIHNGLKKFKCPMCPYSCVDRNSLAKHLRTHTDERPYKCQMCDYSARVSSHLIVHLRTHTGDHPFICSNETCGKMFKTSSDLKRHQRTHSGEKPFACTQCSYRANIKSNLQVHIRVSHSSDKVFSCSQCKVVCSSRQTLNEHEKTHTDALRCNKCDFSSLTPSGLKSHNKIHSPDKLTSCRICSFTTKHRSNWKVHMKRKHPEAAMKKSKFGKAETEEVKVLKMISGSFRCKECSMTFVREDSLRSHVRQHQRKVLASMPGDASSFNPVIQSKPNIGPPVISYPPADISRTLDTQSDLEAHNVSEAHNPVLLYRGIQLPQMDDSLREAEVLAAQNHPSNSLVLDNGQQYVMIQTDSNALNEALSVLPGGMQYVLCESLGPLGEPENSSHLLC